MRLFFVSLEIRPSAVNNNNDDILIKRINFSFEYSTSFSKIYDEYILRLSSRKYSLVNEGNFTLKKKKKNELSNCLS